MPERQRRHAFPKRNFSDIFPAILRELKKGVEILQHMKPVILTVYPCNKRLIPVLCSCPDADRTDRKWKCVRRYRNLYRCSCSSEDAFVVYCGVTVAVERQRSFSVVQDSHWQNEQAQFLMSTVMSKILPLVSSVISEPDQYYQFSNFPTKKNTWLTCGNIAGSRHSQLDGFLVT